jgi:hypothetical protein
MRSVRAGGKSARSVAILNGNGWYTFSISDKEGKKMAAKFRVTYVNHLDSDGNTVEFPTDDFDSNGVKTLSFEFVESHIPRGKGFALETWEYEVEDEDAEQFETGLARISSSVGYKRVGRKAKSK